MADLDEKDRKIITALLENSRQTTGRMSKKLNLPITTIHNRIKKLLREGVIRNFTINLDYKKLGKPIFAHVGVIVDYQAAGRGKKVNQVEVAESIKRIEGRKQKWSNLVGGCRHSR